MSANDEATLLAGVPTGLLIGGEWREATGGGRFDVLDPSTGAVLASVADATPEDGDRRARRGGRRAGRVGGDGAPQARRDPARRAWQLMQDRKDDLALLMTLEMGKPLAEAAGEVAYGSEFFRWFAEEAVRITGRYGINPEGTGRTIVSQHPVGPCYFITPWNFPLAMATRKIGPALAAGCTVVVKPAELTPLTTLLTASILEEAGLPAGVLNVVPTTSAGALTEPVLARPAPAEAQLHRLDAGRASGCSRRRRRTCCAPRWSSAATRRSSSSTTPTSTPRSTGAMLAKFRNVGEACTAANRFIVHEAVADEFVERLTEQVAAMQVGRGTEDGVRDRPAHQRGGGREGRRRWCGTRSAAAPTCAWAAARVDGPGTFYAPTVLDRVDAGSDILRTEIFGPVVAVVRFARRGGGGAHRERHRVRARRPTCSRRTWRAASG